MARRVKVPKGTAPGVGSRIIGLAQDLGGILRSLSLYAAPCLSGGALAAFFHQLLGLQFPVAFTLGFLSLVGPV